jgi:polyhydroxyalkanoate synthesis repressor PhaR
MKKNVAQNNPRAIKKYGSRRLYDLTDRRYISFLDLGKIIGQGYQLYIFDAKTNIDITHETIASYLMENQNCLDQFSNDTLRQIIQAQGYTYDQKRLFSEFLEKTFDLFANHVSLIEESK